jgi:hypothetical protein
MGVRGKPRMCTAARRPIVLLLQLINKELTQHRGSHSSVPGVSHLVGYESVPARVVPSVSQEHNAFTFRLKLSFKEEGAAFWSTLGTANPATWLSPQRTWILKYDTVLYLENVKVVETLHFRMFIIKCYIQPLPDVRKGCVPLKSMQVKYYVSKNFPKFNSIFCLVQEFWDTWLMAPTYFCYPSRVLFLFPAGCEMWFHNFFWVCTGR